MTKPKLTRVTWCTFWVLAPISICLGILLLWWNFHNAQGPINRYTFGERSLTRLWYGYVPRIGPKDVLRSYIHRELDADWLVIAGYTLIILTCGVIFCRLAFSRLGDRFAKASIAALAVAVAADLMENHLIDISMTSWTYQLPIAVTATIKCAALLIALGAIPAAIYTLGRSVRAHVYQFRHWRGGRQWWDRLLPKMPQDRKIEPQSVSITSSPAEVWGADKTNEPGWRAGYSVPGADDVITARKGAPVTALCLSGGGVRSACVAMGAMQTLSQPRPGSPTKSPWMDEFDYVISVSGGGYSAGARLLACQPNPMIRRSTPSVSASTDEGGLIRRIYARVRFPLRRILCRLGLGPRRIDESDPEGPALSERFESGSVEFDYLRRRASYIADSPAALLRALAEVMKNLIAAFFMIYAAAVVVGWLSGLALAHLAIAAFVPLLDHPTVSPGIGSLALIPHAAAWWAVGVPTVLAVVLTIPLLVCQVSSSNKLSTRIQNFSGQLAAAVLCFALAICGLTVALPALMWLSAHLVDGANKQIAAGGISALVVVQYAAALIAMARKHKDNSPIAKPGEERGKRSFLPAGVIQLGIVLLTLLTLGVVWLLALGLSAFKTFSAIVTHAGSPAFPYWQLIISIAAALAVLSFMDVTSLSLYPFYRERLSRVFAVRRDVVGNTQQANVYPPSEMTWLDQYGQANRSEALGKRAPKFLFAAAAAVSGDNKPAPGLNAVSFVMSADYVGGPELGWLNTSELINVAPARLRSDLTVQSAVAISGAAFASAMGRQNHGFQTLLAASGARLGTWLPNPRFVKNVSRHANSGNFPKGLPSVRGISYFYRELFGITRADARLIQVTDGGHYENLGLVEALRRRCRLIVCIDSGGDAPPLLGGLADAMRLAKFELGVDIDLDVMPAPQTSGSANGSTSEGHTTWSVDDLTPGSGSLDGRDDQAEFVCLDARLTKATVLVGRIKYPAAADLGPDCFGTLIFAKTVLWEKLPYWLLTFAASKGNEQFPHDPTSNQWFNEGQFAAYTELGRQIALQAEQAAGDAAQTGIGRPPFEPPPTPSTAGISPDVVGAVATGASRNATFASERVSATTGTNGHSTSTWRY
ncbi:hypothetical protein [Mycobacterium sp. SA01]|uniref:hypothetical protein n=1 Tax=Mycobacterium sp. SA01 TaxID=3238820 RepID=UPI00351B2BCB